MVGWNSICHTQSKVSRRKESGRTRIDISEEGCFGTGLLAGVATRHRKYETRRKVRLCGREGRGDGTFGISVSTLS